MLLQVLKKYSTSTIEEFLSLKLKQCVYKVPLIISVGKKLVTEFSSYRIEYKNHENFYKCNESRRPEEELKKKLPLVDEIRGLDQSAYMSLYSNNKIPTIAQTKFFLLRFFPKQHYLSLFRKSNIAYTFTNKGGYKLNNPELENAIDAYKGKYRNNSMFSKNIRPLDTAFGRYRYRRYVRRILCNTIQETVPFNKIHTVEGIFQFQFRIVPTNPKDRQEIRNSIKHAISTVTHNRKFQNKLLITCKKLNNPKRIKQLKFTIISTVKNDLTVDSVNAKLPFINDENDLAI
jgi:hypothetical protein